MTQIMQHTKSRLVLSDQVGVRLDQDHQKLKSSYATPAVRKAPPAATQSGTDDLQASISLALGKVSA